MIEALAGIFAAYAGYTGWPWWTAILVGALSGFQVANARLYRGALKDRVAAGDRSVSAKFFQISLIGIIAGAFAGGASTLQPGGSWLPDRRTMPVGSDASNCWCVSRANRAGIAGYDAALDPNPSPTELVAETGADRLDRDITGIDRILIAEVIASQVRIALLQSRCHIVHERALDTAPDCPAVTNFAIGSEGRAVSGDRLGYFDFTKGSTARHIIQRSIGCEANAGADRTDPINFSPMKAKAERASLGRIQVRKVDIRFNAINNALVGQVVAGM